MGTCKREVVSIKYSHLRNHNSDSPRMYSFCPPFTSLFSYVRNNLCAVLSLPAAPLVAGVRWPIRKEDAANTPWKYHFSMGELTAHDLEYLCSKLCSILPMLSAASRGWVSSIDPIENTRARHRINAHTQKSSELRGVYFVFREISGAAAHFRIFFSLCLHTNTHSSDIFCDLRAKTFAYVFIPRYGFVHAEDPDHAYDRLIQCWNGPSGCGTQCLLMLCDDSPFMSW